MDRLSEISPAYLAATEVIDWQHPAVLKQAKQLSASETDPLVVVERCFNWVRDQVGHCVDVGAEKLTCTASEVLLDGQGFCYAKSHLLAALLRANGIPCGFDYQRLRDGDQFMLHGLNVIYLPEFGWYRVDARGNKPGVDARFEPPVEHLAWPVQQPGEVDYHLKLAEPLPEVVAALRKPLTVQTLWPVLPSSIRMA